MSRVKERDKVRDKILKNLGLDTLPGFREFYGQLDDRRIGGLYDVQTQHVISECETITHYKKKQSDGTYTYHKCRKSY
jgi:hypothetical protein